MYQFNASAVQRARARRGLTREQLADALGVPMEEIAAIERGRVNPMALVLKLAGVLSLEINELVSGSFEDDLNATYFTKQTGSCSTALYRLMEASPGKVFTIKMIGIELDHVWKDAAVTSALRRMVTAGECTKVGRGYGRHIEAPPASPVSAN